jgi:hypothetical protein
MTKANLIKLFLGKKVSPVAKPASGFSDDKAASNATTTGEPVLFNLPYPSSNSFPSEVARQQANKRAMSIGKIVGAA